MLWLYQRHAPQTFRVSVWDEEGHSYSLCYVMLVMRRKFRALWRDF